VDQLWSYFMHHFAYERVAYLLIENQASVTCTTEINSECFACMVDCFLEFVFSVKLFGNIHYLKILFGNTSVKSMQFLNLYISDGIDMTISYPSG
jgi:hypothetical protein